ncbi:MAG: hypothetical protein M3253_06115, partial [Chloroflexota bacterium]|nr:hypothetical protein [Chloroflexota bacterium]
MLRILRAFAWLRWRVLLNSLERRDSRDVLERFSVAMEQLAPAIIALVMVPSALALAGAGAYAGWALAGGQARVALFELLRFMLLAGFGFAVVAPLLLPAGERTNPVRLLLLPIPRGALYLAQSMTALADPWMLLLVSIVLAIPIGLAAGGALAPAAVAALAGLLLLSALAGITLVVTSAIDLAVRNRRRGELLALIVILLIPVLGLLPSLLDKDRRQRRQEARVERPASTWWPTVGAAAMAVLPPETYAETTRAAAQGEYRRVPRPFLTLAGAAALLHGLAFAMFIRVLGAPALMGSGRAASRSLRAWRVPGVSPGASAVAVNQVRLALRTPRGRATLLSPLVVFLMLAAMLFRRPSGIEFAFMTVGSGIGLAAFTSAVSLLAILPLAMNQFAVDRAGLTLALLAPLPSRALLAGKAVGNALVVAIPAGLCTAAALALFPSGHPALWLSVPLALVATYLLAAPAAAALS